MDELNDEQLRAVEAGDGPVAVIAGPGTGKTKTLVARIEYLIKSKRADPDEILALTFTKKAAEEMQDRLESSVKVSTFHGLCFEILDEDKPFVSEAERLAVIKDLKKPRTLKSLSARELGLAISRAKNSTETPEIDLGKVVGDYNKALAKLNVRDFDDLLVDARELLKKEKSKLLWRYILVDEFQDTNSLQYEILKLILDGNNLFVIGDPNQSIYGFRGASGSIFERFKDDFKDVTKVTLSANYRSMSAVVGLANAIFGTSDLQAKSKESGRVRTVEVLNEYGEAHWVIAEIQKAIGGGDLQRAVSDDERGSHRRLSDFAVLYRSRPAASALQKLMNESGLPYQIVGDGSPYEKSEIQAVIERLRGLDDQTTPAAAAAEGIIAGLNLPSGRDLQQFIATLVRFGTTAAALKYLDKIAEQGFYDSEADAITLLTIHASKGLEFPVVFLIGVEEGTLPSGRGDEAEEKRLFYVAVTRARERLEITHARNRGGQPAQPSRFLRQAPVDILPRLIDPAIPDQLRRIQKSALRRSQQSLF
jgi:superfamily I DNA/RNA helicase